MDGVELRNDLDQPLFDGGPASRDVATGLAIYALAEVKAFNVFSDDTFVAAIALMDLAVASGAQAIALIPQVGGAVPAHGLQTAMSALGPELAKRNLIGLIEPIGFENSTLRTKAEVVAVLDTDPHGAQFGLIHDTFHHHLAGEAEIFPAHTKLVHMSGVSDPRVAVADMRDGHRVLVDAQDRLGTIAQIQELLRGGYAGPVSFEVFSPDVHALIDPKAALSRSIRFIETEVMAHAA